jgi:hypothetical protein
VDDGEPRGLGRRGEGSRFGDQAGRGRGGGRLFLSDFLERVKRYKGICAAEGVEKGGEVTAVP